MAAEKPRLLLDISRTVARARLLAPTGIDRVERAYIGWALERSARFLARIGHRQYLCGAETARDLAKWLDGTGTAPPLDFRGAINVRRDKRLRRAEALIRRTALGWASSPAQLEAMLRDTFPSGGVYLNTGHDNLVAGQMSAIKSAGLARAVLLHDLIPIDHPEYTRSGTAERFAAKLAAAAVADLLICNSADTRRRVLAAFAGPSHAVVAPLGVERMIPPETSPGGPARFVCLGTIEPRKNHQLLLDIWSGMWGARPPEEQPHLLIVGRRGWENRRVFRELDTAPMMSRTVFEYAGLNDDRLAGHLIGARALLFPSFAEGFGLPLAEALCLGVPVIASDLPALREIGGDVPEWLPPTDVGAWARLIDAYARDPSPERDAQLSRLTDWRPPTWETHFSIVSKELETILAQNGTGR